MAIELGLLTGYPVGPRDCTAKVPHNLKRSYGYFASTKKILNH